MESWTVGDGPLVGLLVDEGERALAGEDDGVEDLRDLLGHAGPEVVRLEQPAVDQRPAHAAGRVVVERLVDVRARGVPEAHQDLGEAIGGVLAGGAADLAVLEDDRAFAARGVEAEGAGPAGLAEEGDEVGEREPGGVAHHHDARSLAATALRGLAKRGEEVRRGGEEEEASASGVQLALGLGVGDETPSGLDADAGGHGRAVRITGWPWSRFRGSSASRARHPP